MLEPNTLLAYKWAFTDNQGYVKFRELKPLPFPEIAKSLLTNLFLEEVEPAEYRRIVLKLIMKVGKP